MTNAKPRGQSLYEEACEVIPGGVNSATRYVGRPYAFTGADGAYITDADGGRYVDYHAAFGAILLGHNEPLVNDAVRGALDGVDLIGAGVTPIEIEFAKLICSVIPSAEMVTNAMSGSEATAYAIRLARAETGRSLIVKFQGGYHGWHDAVARNVISPPSLAYGMDPVSAGILEQALTSTLIAEFNDLSSVQALFDEHPEQIAAVILEPIPHNVGALLPTQEFVEGLRSLTSSAGALLIFDEVITGFRHTLGGYQSVCGITPDLTTFGKAVANGFPLAGLAGPRSLMSRFTSAGGDVALLGTFNGYPIGCAAGIATVSYLRDNPSFYARTETLGERMRSGLRSIVDEFGFAGQVRGFGSVFVLYFMDAPVLGYRDLMRNDDKAYLEFHRRMADAGFFMLPMSLKRNHVSGAHTEDDIDRTLEASRDVLKGMLHDGVLTT
ncbi:aspartate aminotransferase family protein [Tenggerimyces flavus]|uniref:Aspartate aminotransferase family protein n=1 Tax=Tenggerimyces flavus TaxID=1708749 RepID=A0ABV7YG54_9ACTN|nr:aspartate aminotransferase family protein [Tenggerimyces flavus]MBM7788114.1 glutamate-1-semialdehyde 2,1-aminomutase [Tenggerimyces flavus]